uniref:Uncharacterized protein n=1 Tax=Kalanchoe fedtschenkoi TaxID=63787 RepID=A0A7N0VAN8_KALFE
MHSAIQLSRSLFQPKAEGSCCPAAQVSPEGLIVSLWWPWPNIQLCCSGTDKQECLLPHLENIHQLR